MSLFSADLLDIYDNVPLFNYLLTGLLVVMFNCCNYTPLIKSACRSPQGISYMGPHSRNVFTAKYNSERVTGLLILFLFY